MLKKKCLVIAVALILLLSAVSAALADDPVKLVVNGKEIKSDVPPQIINGRTVVPVRWIAEALGASVEWDQDTQTVRITDNEKQKLQRKVELLEYALLPGTPEEAAVTWAQGVKTRNGAMQYAALSPELREQYGPSFDSFNWVTGASSPWVDSFQISEKEKLADGSYKFEIKFNLATSTGSAGTSTAEIIVDQARDGQYPLPVYPGTEGKWLITKMHYPDEPEERNHAMAIDEYNITLNMPDDWEIKRNNGEISIVDAGGNNIGGIDKLGGAYLPNHSKIISEKKISSYLGEGKLFVLRRSYPAASGLKDEWQEIHALQPLEGGQSWLNLWVKVGAGEEADQIQAVVEMMMEGIKSGTPANGLKAFINACGDPGKMWELMGPKARARYGEAKNIDYSAYAEGLGAFKSSAYKIVKEELNGDEATVEISGDVHQEGSFYKDKHYTAKMVLEDGKWKWEWNMR